MFSFFACFEFRTNVRDTRALRLTVACSHQCPFCDGYEHKDYPIGLLSFPSANYAHIALMCRTLNPDVTVYSNGPVPSDADTQAALAKVKVTGIKFDERRIKRLVNNGVGPAKGITLEFESGPPVRRISRVV